MRRTVTGTGSFSNAVTWSVSPAAAGTVSSAGVFTASAAGATTVTATSTQDTAKSGSASVTVAQAAATITSVSVSCAQAAVSLGQTVQCAAIVQGSGAFDPSVSWSVGSIAGGNAAVGSISAAGLFMAPSSVPSTFTESVAAIANGDPTKSSSTAITIAGTVASVSQPVTSASGGTATLPDGSSVAIAAGVVPSDQTVSVSSVSWLPSQPPNTSIVQAGTALEIDFATPMALGTGTMHHVSLAAAAGAAAPVAPITFTIANAPGNQGGLDGSMPMANFVLADGSSDWVGVQGNYDSTTGIYTGTVGSDILSGFINKVVTSIRITGVKLLAAAGGAPPIDPGRRSFVGGDNPWTTFTCPSGRVLLLVHGMLSSVESAFPAASVEEMKSKGGYTGVIGFDYDWTQDLNDSGSALAEFLTYIHSTCTGVQQIDIEAHSEGVPVSMSAITQAPSVNVQHLISLGGPIMGSPAAGDPRLMAALIADSYSPGWVKSYGIKSAAYLASGAPFVLELRPNAPAPYDVLGTIRSKLASMNNPPQIIAVGGYVPHISFQSQTYDFSILIPLMGVKNFDGIVPLSSALGFGSGLNLRPLPPQALGHTDLPSDPGVVQLVADQVAGALQPTLSFAQPENCANGTSCIAPAGTAFNFDGAGYSAGGGVATFELLGDSSFSQPDTTLTANDAGSLPEGAWQDAVDCAAPATMKLFFASDVATGLSSNAVTEDDTAGSCAANPAPTISGVSVDSSVNLIRITGTGFSSTTSVVIPGLAVPAYVVSSDGQLLSVGLTADDLSSAGTYTVTVTNPPPGGGSASATFTITPVAASYTVTATASAGGTISPASSTVVSGSSTSLTVTPDAGFVVSSVSGCGGVLGGSTFTTGPITADCTVTASFVAAAAGEWTWVSGSNTAGAKGVYGVQGEAAPTNVPGARHGAASWVDASGDLWLFGGAGLDSQSSDDNDLSDLWEFSPTTGLWTWVAGPNLGGAPGEYGEKGQGTESTSPGARDGATTWSDPSGGLWLFGGQGLGADGSYGYLNDLWEFSRSKKQWIWVAGSQAVNTLANFGVEGEAAATNTPGGLEGAVSWVDAQGTLWLFGGLGEDGSGGASPRNDLWSFSPSTKEWTWVSGSSTASANSFYGTEGTPSVRNVPGGRVNAQSWIDSAGKLWLFGGKGYDSFEFEGPLDDVWEFSPSAGEWTWVGGSDMVYDSLFFGVQGQAAPTTSPGGVIDAAFWLDPSGRFWIFGGAVGMLVNDLWQYSPATREWTWVTGAVTEGASGTYGDEGHPGAANSPGARYSATSWADPAGNLWLFGGTGYDSSGALDSLNDLWEFRPAVAAGAPQEMSAKTGHGQNPH